MRSIGDWIPPLIEINSWKPKAPKAQLLAVELCCGMGALGLGLRSLGIRIAHAYDSWDAAVKIYNHNVAKPVAVQCDLLTEKGHRQVLSDSFKLGQLDILAAGPPCKGFSRLVNGHHNLPNPHNRVLMVLPDYVAVLKPRIVLIENVPDLLRHENGKTFKNFIERLKAPGPRCLSYRVEFQIYDASLYGTPQVRHRVFILAVRDGNEHLPLPGPDLTSFFSALRHGNEISKRFQPYLSIL